MASGFFGLRDSLTTTNYSVLKDQSRGMRARAERPRGHSLDPGLGFEPRLTVSETVILPVR